MPAGVPGRERKAEKAIKPIPQKRFGAMATELRTAIYECHIK
jgi:hypothetical protein